jgi:hypothetical protein
MADTRLVSFVESALRAGATRATVEKALRDAGWSNEQVTDALEHFSEVEFVVPVPRPKAQLSARDAFLYTVMFATLYVSAYNLGNLLFQLVNLAIPDPLEADLGSYIAGHIRWAAASIIVAFPIFLLVARRIAREVLAEPSRRASGIRKWLTYLTLAATALIIVGDVIVLVFNLLGGELTLRFALKVLVVGGLAGAIFGYYSWSMKADDKALRQ